MTELFQIAIFPIVLTLAAFRIGQFCQKKWPHPLCNPTLIAMILVVVFLLATGMDVKTYASGAKYLSWLMTPATISLAIPMYEQFQVLRKSLAAVVIGVTAGSLACLVFLLAGGIFLSLEPQIVVSFLPKSITTAIGVPLSELFGGLGALTTAAIIVTGILGNMLGSSLCKMLRITDPVAQGVAFGTSAHVIGTSRAGELSPLAGAAGSLSLVVAGLLTALLFPTLHSFL